MPTLLKMRLAHERLIKLSSLLRYSVIYSIHAWNLPFTMIGKLSERLRNLETAHHNRCSECTENTFIHCQQIIKPYKAWLWTNDELFLSNQRVFKLFRCLKLTINWTNRFKPSQNIVLTWWYTFRYSVEDMYKTTFENVYVVEHFYKHGIFHSL